MRSEVPEDWRVAPFSALARYENGRAFKPADWGSEGLPIVRIAQITNPDSDTNRYSGQVDSRHLLGDGDLIFSWSATLAVMKWTRGPAVLNQHLFKVTPADGVDQDWLQFRLGASIPDLTEEAHGTTMKHIRKGTLSSQTTLVPPLDEQRRIAEVLRSLDEVIGLSRRAVDQAKRALEFAREHLTGLDGSEPGWKLQPVLDCFQLQRGHDLPVQNRKDGTVPVIASNGPIGFHDQAPIPAPAVITGRSGTIGKVTYFDGPCWPLNTTLFVRDFKGGDPRFVYHFLAAFPLAQHATGTGVPTLNRNDVHAVEVGWPEAEEQHRRVAVLDSLETTWLAAQGALKANRTLKEKLASDLLLGRVRVPA